jgi:CMP-N,N'-diacetyllegionaminic acid synthase
VSEILALIPARGGSKALPGKNVRLLAGKPLIAHSIATSLASQPITRTIVSTDDEQIASVAREYGVEVPFMRPPELAQDDSTDLEAFRHALEWLRDEEGYEPELVVHLRPTHPLRRVERVDQAIRLLLGDPEADSLRSVARPHQTPYKMWRIEHGYLRPLLHVEGLPDAHSLPRQRLPEVWWQNGYVDVIRPRTILELGSMSGARILPFVIEEPTVEIDYEDALERAEELLRSGGADAPAQPRHPS